MSKILYIEPYAGIAGDIFTAALIGLLDDPNKLYEQIYTLPIQHEFKVETTTVFKSGIKANKFSVHVNNNLHKHHHGRQLHKIIDIINKSNISEKAKETAISIFKNLAEAESEIHGSTSDHVHFHEVGAVDAIVDICSIAILLDLLKFDKIISAPVSVGTGTIKAAHGVLPVPCPATSLLLKNLPINYTGIKSELTTPTGAATLKTIVNSWNNTINGKTIQSVYGAGTKDIKEIINVLRVSIIKENTDTNNFESDQIAVVECNIDDFPGEHFSYLENTLFDAGALDYIIIPGTMKKSRPGILLQVISPLDKKESIAETLLMNTSTIGVRYRIEERAKLKIKLSIVETPLGTVKAKLLFKNNKLVKFKVEQIDIQKICKTHNKNYISVLNEINYHVQQWINSQDYKN